MSEIQRHLAHLKIALLALTPSGENGFEGLVKEALQEVAAMPFRLAASGRQFGVDGKAAFDEDGVCFEAKRYEDNPDRNTVLVKIADLVRNQDHPDLVWALCATCSVSSQLADDIKADAARVGITTIILDWPENGIGSLAVMLAMAGDRVISFLEGHADATTIRAIQAAIKAITDEGAYGAHASRIRGVLDAPAIASEKARSANAQQLERMFSTKERARAFFGQPLAPLAEDSLLPRSDLISKLRPILSDRPQGRVVVVLGEEGCGKTWIVAQTWLQQRHRPLMLLVSAETITTDSPREQDIENHLIALLIEQTSERPSPVSVERWRVRLDRWRRRTIELSAPRLVVFIDGINQRPELNWGRVIERYAHFLDGLGCNLIVTSRTAYYRDRVRGRLSREPAQLIVPQWTGDERDEILRAHDINPARLKSETGISLLNPRLLSIALELQTRRLITDIDELTVGQVLFEHIRFTARNGPENQDAEDFAQTLRKHAEAIVTRSVSGLHKDALLVFEADRTAVRDGRFFQAVVGEPHRYTLRSEGLALALGFSIVDQLKQAHRESRNLEDALTAMLQPIASLDNTADIVIAALTIVTLDASYAPHIAAALVVGFGSLQNPAEEKFAAFRRLAKIQPHGYLEAMRLLLLFRVRKPNFDWIRASVLALDASCPTVSSVITDWLSLKSLSPELGMLTRPMHDPADKVAEEREKRQHEIEVKLTSMSPDERKILSRLLDAEGDITALSRFALYMLAGKPLAPFAEQLVNWSFSNAFNSSFVDGHDDFLNLLRLNRVDWEATRRALLSSVVPLRSEGTSHTGKWALVTVLRAIGHPDDAREAEALVADLTKDRPRFPGWSLLEEYCATDPCDPASLEPENISVTADQYRAIDVCALRGPGGLTKADMLFDMARAGMSRFQPGAAIEKHRQFADDVIDRSGDALRLGLFELHEHNALLQPPQAMKLVQKWRNNELTKVEGSFENDDWITSQYMVLVALPLCAPLDRLKILLDMPEGTPVMLDILALMEPVPQSAFVAVLHQVRACRSLYQEHLLLEYLRSTRMPLPHEAAVSLEQQISSPDDGLRRACLGLVAERGEAGALSSVVQSGWRADRVSKGLSFEVWYGSIALVRAAAQGLLAASEMLERISPQAYAHAATVLKGETASTIAQLIDNAIAHALGIASNLVVPDLEIEMSTARPGEPDRVSVDLRPPRDADEALQRWSDRANDAENWRRNHATFDAFRDKLVGANGSIIIERIQLDEFAAIAATSEALTNKWFQNFIDARDANLSAVCNLVHLLAYALSEGSPERSKMLFERVRHINPIVRFLFTPPEVDLRMKALWSAHDSPLLDQERAWRLDSAKSDQALATEILAALSSGKRQFVEDYVALKLASIEPSNIARGLMVAGLSDQSQVNDEFLAAFEGKTGFIGSALRAANYAYGRNRWARHWYSLMCIATGDEEFWRYQVQLNKIVDGRFVLWSNEFAWEGVPAKRFGPTISRRVRHRYARWKHHRESKLFGLSAPDDVFLQ